MISGVKWCWAHPTPTSWFRPPWHEIQNKQQIDVNLDDEDFNIFYFIYSQKFQPGWGCQYLFLFPEIWDVWMQDSVNVKKILREYKYSSFPNSRMWTLLAFHLKIMKYCDALWKCKMDDGRNALWKCINSTKLIYKSKKQTTVGGGGVTNYASLCTCFCVLRAGSIGDTSEGLIGINTWDNTCWWLLQFSTTKRYIYIWWLWF